MSPDEQIVVLERKVREQADEIDRLRKGIAGAVNELDADHHPLDYGKEPVGCTLCYPGDGHWPCTSRQITDDLRALTEQEEPVNDRAEPILVILLAVILLVVVVVATFLIVIAIHQPRVSLLGFF